MWFLPGSEIEYEYHGQSESKLLRGSKYFSERVMNWFIFIFVFQINFWNMSYSSGSGATENEYTKESLRIRLKVGLLSQKWPCSHAIHYHTIKIFPADVLRNNVLEMIHILGRRWKCMERIKQIQIQQRGSMVCPFEKKGFFSGTASPHWNPFIGIKEMFQC